MNVGAVAKGKWLRVTDEFMNGLLSQPALLRLFQTTRKQLESFFRAVIRFVFTILQTLR